MSSEVVYSQNKQLAYFHLDSSVNIQKDPLLQVPAYTTFIHHYHYPVVYYEELYNYFKNCLHENVVPGNIRIFYQKKQLNHELPIGIFLERQSNVKQFQVSVDCSVKVPDAFRVIKNSWKKAFQVVNNNRRCDYVKTRLSENELKEKFQKYYLGKTHNLHREGLYEGTHVIVRGIVLDGVIQRKYEVAEFKYVGDIARQIFNQPEIWKNKQPQIFSHGIEIPLDMESRFFLDEWNYNDGYCYLVLKI